VECGGFFIFASPLVYIQGYTDDGVVPDELSEGREKGSDRSDLADGELVKAARAQSHLEDAAMAQLQLSLPKATPRERRRTMLSHLYGAGVYRNREILQDKIKKGGQGEGAFTHAFAFLQENLDEIDDPLLKLMPLLRKISKENVIPIMDFEDQTQVDLNFLLIHVFDCLPSAPFTKPDHHSTVALSIPTDLNTEVTFLDLPDVEQVPLAQVRKYLRYGSKLGPAALSHRSAAPQGTAWATGTPALQHAQRAAGATHDEKSQSDEDEEAGESASHSVEKTKNGTKEKSGGDRSRGVEARLFAKHGFDVVLITNQTKGVVSELDTPPEGAA